MKSWKARALVCLPALARALLARAETVSGAGSTAAAPIYRAWAQAYRKSTGATLTYEAVGSSAGLKKIRSGETGFGASDVAPTEAELASDGLVLIPVAITGVAPVVHLPRVADGQLRLTGEVLARIFMGQVTRWSAPEVRELNPGLQLPDLPIRPIARSDGSGTTYNFTDYLAKVHAPWKAQMGVKAQIAWPAGVAAAAGTNGVVKAVHDTVGAIAYVDFGYVAENRLATVALRNEEGEFVPPTVPAFQAALAASDWSAKGTFNATLTAQKGRASWPITMGTFALVPRVSDKPEQTLAALKFFAWAFKNGDALVQQAHFVRLPDRVQANAAKAISTVRDRSGKPLGLAAL